VVRGTGTVLNMVTILVGSGLGVLLRGRLPERTRTTVTDGLGRGIEQLALTSTLDGFAALAFAASLGWGSRRARRAACCCSASGCACSPSSSSQSATCCRRWSSRRC
jgi:uncharacterized membrane protein YqgA involved in biofilm formation